MAKTYAEINDKIKKYGCRVDGRRGIRTGKNALPERDCGESGCRDHGHFRGNVFLRGILNFGHANPPIRMEKIELNGIRVSGGLAAVDTYVGATDCNPENPSYGEPIS